MQTKAKVTTTSGQAYLRKLCRHFARRVPATLTGDQGIVDFPFGRCRIDATPGHLQVVIDIDDGKEVASAEPVVTDHLLRMARGEDLLVQWQRSAR